MTAIDAAKLVYAFCQMHKIEVNALKIHKSMYYMQAWHMVYFEGAQLIDEAPQAWRHGPVYRGAYLFIKKALSDKSLVKETFLDNLRASEQYEKIIRCSFEGRSEDEIKEESNYITSVLARYATQSHNRLVDMTHREKPWLETRGDLFPWEASKKEIPLDLIHSYYSERLGK